MTQSRGQNENGDSSFPEELRERYDKVRFVGKGGMGKVYFAKDIRLNRHVAIKLLPHTTNSSDSVVRFHQEARAVSKLNNPHIVQVLDFGSTENSDFFMVMEFIAGQDLESMIGKLGTIPVRRAIEIATQICIGLEHAHANGIVHRDLKPANIMIDENNNVRILDFGVAKIVDQNQSDDRLTRPGQALGSILYMSPEQMRGEDSDFRSDVYSAGLVIYKMVAGKLPHEDENVMKVIRFRLEEVTPPVLPITNDSDPNAEIVAKLNNVLSIALSPKAIDRFDSMTALHSALDDCLSSDVTHDDNDSRTKNILKLGAAALILIPLIFILVSLTANPPTKGLQKKVVATEKPLHASDDKKLRSPLERTKDGTLMPPGFSEEDEDGQIYWVAHDYVTNEDLKPLLPHYVPKLSLQNNANVTVEGLKIILPLKVQALSLRDTKIGDESIDLLNQMDLSELILRHCKMTEHGILKLKGSRRLVSLDLKYLSITKRGLDDIVHKFPNLESLNIGESRFSTQDLDALSKLKRLRCIYVENVGLDDKGVQKLAQRKEIVRLELAQNPITDLSVDYLMKKPKLEWVSFGACPNVSSSAALRLQDHFGSKTKIDLPTAPKPLDDINEMFLEVSK